MSIQFDLNLLSLYRQNSQEFSTHPGLMAVAPPRRPARGRGTDRLLIYLTMAGTTQFTSRENQQLMGQMAAQFYRTPGSLTSALRAAAENLNQALLERNRRTGGEGQYAIGWMVLGALRDTQLLLLMCGPTHVFWLRPGGTEHVYNPALSGKGLGLSQTTNLYYARVDLQPSDRLLFCGQVPTAWEQTLLNDRSPASLGATYRRLMTLSGGDLNAVLIQVQPGTGQVNLLNPSQAELYAPSQPRSVSEPVAPALPPAGASSDYSEDQPASPELEGAMSEAPATSSPPAYGIPPSPATELPPTNEWFAELQDSSVSPSPSQQADAPAISEMGTSRTTPRPAVGTRQAARWLVVAMQTGQRLWGAFVDRLRNFLPRLLPGAQSDQPLTLSTSTMAFIAIAVPLVVVTIASLVYFHYGQGAQFESYLAQADLARTQALGLDDPAKQAETWQAVLFYLDKAEAYRTTDETQNMRQQAQNSLDTLLGIVRLDFLPAFTEGLGRSVNISHLAANDADLYMLDTEKGNVLHASLSGRGYQLDNTFNCDPGSYGSYQVGPLVDILALPKNNTLNAGVLGIDSNGNLLYCSPGETAQAIPLPPPDTNWRRIAAFTLDNGNLYVLDSAARAVWVYIGQQGAFVDRPLFFFGEQIPPLEDAIDLAVNGDDLYVLHADGHLSTCSYSHNSNVPTRCVDPAEMTNPFPATQGAGIFTQAHFTQMLFNSPPDSAILLLDADGRSIFRFSPRSLELQNQLRSQPGRDDPLPTGPAKAMTVSSNHVLYLAVGDQVYFSTDAP
jgi:hypothetical protein